MRQDEVALCCQIRKHEGDPEEHIVWNAKSLLNLSIFTLSREARGQGSAENMNVGALYSEKKTLNSR